MRSIFIEWQYCHSMNINLELNCMAYLTLRHVPLWDELELRKFHGVHCPEGVMLWDTWTLLMVSTGESWAPTKYNFAHTFGPVTLWTNDPSSFGTLASRCSCCLSLQQLVLSIVLQSATCVSSSSGSTSCCDLLHFCYFVALMSDKENRRKLDWKSSIRKVTVGWTTSYKVHRIYYSISACGWVSCSFRICLNVIVLRDKFGCNMTMVLCLEHLSDVMMISQAFTTISSRITGSM